VILVLSKIFLEHKTLYKCFTDGIFPTCPVLLE
jgi:hypothetical protein